MKSITLASLLVSQSSRAFTTTILSSPWPVRHPLTSNSLLHYEPEGNNDNEASSSSSSQQGRPSLASSQSSQEEQLSSDTLGTDGMDLQLPLPPAFPPPDQVHDDGPRASEFHGLAPRPVGPARRSRLAAEARASAVYVPGGSDAYWDLQDEIRGLEADLATATRLGDVMDAVGGGGEVEADGADADALRGRLRRARARDPAHVYRVVGGASLSAGDQSERYRKESLRARRMLPQFNLEGLWVGRYGDGFEMINVTYSGDTLVAYKVTGDQNIPRGEVSFTSDLSPHRDHHDSLDPITLSEGAAKKWGVKRLPRFPGRGHAAEPGFRNPHALEGQLVVIGADGDYFSFAWVPLEHQIFFGRPSPELTLKMLREGGGASMTAGAGKDAPAPDAGRRERTEYADRCLEATADALFDEASEGKADPFSCIWRGDDAEYCYFE